MDDQALSGHGRTTRACAALPIVALLGMSLAVAAASRAEERERWTPGEPAQVLVGSGREPDWSRTGNLIVYRADEGIYTVDAVTLAVTQWPGLRATSTSGSSTRAARRKASAR